MIEDVITAWFVLSGLSLAFLVIDIRTTPAPNVIKAAFIILVAFTGPIGALLYVIGCREPWKGAHEQFVAATWRQVLGSTMHCAAGDGIGIIAGAALAPFLHLSPWGDFTLEYALGFGFGWTFFQAYAMRDMAGGSYLVSLKETFIPELLSMNLLMTGMVPTMKVLMHRIEGATDPLRPGFWFTMSMALIVGFALAYPVNWWLVVNNLKHGMLTIRPGTAPAAKQDAHEGMAAGDGRHAGGRPGFAMIAAMVLMTFALLAAGLWFSGAFFD